MAKFDRRVVPEPAIDVMLRCQAAVPCHLGGGAALAGLHLRHRLSRDLDLFVHDRGAHRDLVDNLAGIAADAGVGLELVRDRGTHVRALLHLPGVDMELDVVHESLVDLGSPEQSDEGVVVESLLDLRASKLTCLLSRAEPRDLVDVMFLERAGFSPESDLGAALEKDAGINPGTLAWLLSGFPVAPLPRMLSPLPEAELRAYRDALAARFKALAVPEAEG